MFEKEEEYVKPLSKSLKVAIISYNTQSNQLCANIEEKINNEIKKKLEFIYVDNIRNLYKYKEELYIEEKVKGLLNKKWMYNVMNVIPSIIIIHYKISIGVNKESEEKNIYQILEEIRSYSKTCIIIFILISEDMAENPYNFNIEDKTKPYCIKNYMHKNDFYIFQVEEIWKTNEFMNICNKIYLNSREFYRKYKKKYKEKREKTKIREERIDYDIKLGILSSIKSKQNKIKRNKYFKEAYDLLNDKSFDKTNYIYGTSPVRNKNNFYELRAIADWLFYKCFNTQNATFKELKEIYKSHIFSFSNINYYDNQEKDYFHFAEYYWLYTRYKNWSDLIENIINNDKNSSKNNLILFGMILLKQVYYITKMIKFHQKYLNGIEFDLSTVLINGKKIDIKDVQQEENIFLGKPPIYYILDKDIDKDKEKSNKIKIIENDLWDEIYIKKFISDNNINIKDFIDILKNTYFEKIFIIFKKIKNEYSKKPKNNKNIADSQGINFYINALKIISLNNSKENGGLFEVPEICDAILNIHKIILNSTHIQKFTKLYIHFLKQYINLIQYKIKVEKDKDSSQSSENNIDINNYKTELLINVSKLGNITKLNQDEENFFYDLINDTQFETKIQTIDNKDTTKDNNKINIVLNYYNKANICFYDYNNLSFNFNYSIKDIDKYQDRKILDLVEYELKFNSSLSKGNFKFNSLKLFFKYINEEEPNVIKSEMLVKEYNKDELDKYEFGSNSNISIFHKLLLKYKRGKVYLNKIMFSLCKKENVNYLINIPYESDKAIFLNGEDNYALEFKFPEKVSTVGINQLFRFEYEIIKKSINNIKIKDYKISFEGNGMPNTTIYNIKKGKHNSNEAPLYNNLDDYLDPNYNNNKLRKKVSGSFHIKKNIQEESSLNQFIFNNNERRMSMKKKISRAISLPIIYYFNEEKNCIEEYKNFCEIKYDNFESKLKEEKNKFDILIKFSEYEIYKIKLSIKYTIQHEETGDVMEFSKENIFCFKVINPMMNTYNIMSENYILYKKGKINELSKDYLTDTNIKINLKFNNLLQEDIIIKDIIITLNDILSSKNKIEINSTLKDIIDNKDIEEQIKEEIFLIMKSSNYIIPFDLKFNTPFYGCIGKCKIIWTTKSLKEFQSNKNCQTGLKLYNENEFEFPNINVNLIELKYNYQKVVIDNMIILNIKIHNNSHLNKNLFIKVENNDESGSFISGLKKQKVFLESKEAVKFSLKIIAFQKGDLKLPNIIVAETNFTGKELLTNYYYPEKILINN